MIARTRALPASACSASAARPATHSVWPTGLRSSGPSSRNIAPHSMNTVCSTLWVSVSAQ